MQHTSSCQASTVSAYSTSSTSFQLFPYHFSENKNIEKTSSIAGLMLTCVFLGVTCLDSLSGLENRALFVSRAESHALFTTISGSQMLQFLFLETEMFSGDISWMFLVTPGLVMVPWLPCLWCSFPSTTATPIKRKPMRDQFIALLANQRLPRKMAKMSI